MNQSLSNHFAAIQNLYQKGVRSLVMPNVVDLMQVPFYVQSPAAEKSFIRARIAEYNLGFTARLNQARTAFPNLVIHAPDIRSLLDDILARPSAYGVTNAQEQGFNIDALSDPQLTDKSLNGPGRDYIFWEYLDPTAKVHAILADFVQNLISPARINEGMAIGSSNEWHLANLPIGLSGFVDGSTNFVDWSPVTNFTSTNTMQPVLVPATQPIWFYRLRFPFAWSWP
jgi:phospholipase/lecithinase/hemolysin